ncbi:hypothetical protein MOV66_01615 [Agrobacterium sp. SHOUNA12C]|uniref:hypothetical protein n=1 Tax=Rhizobium rhizogenes TaxID=359 RepID=UPI0012D2D7B5|nr:hypothetical protein [Rhizobium rhizogenes]MCJ9719734.1 hypothetical protein [Agrobacterium sp. BETTINA12B]MCJ9755331.1 hypothetical protein [Agrobacterium sp. SHOUNA12C]NTF55719.1 hypothetical protein [Rhizobium rhizogenes]NTF62078.1 hypothetical protein [Rhizobium rhizogenes]NTF75299.1 hypothetical protein [Rhizobium rhizogenes]
MPLDHLGNRQSPPAAWASPEKIEIQWAGTQPSAFPDRDHATAPKTTIAGRHPPQHVSLAAIFSAGILIDTNYVVINVDVNMIYVNYFASVWSCRNPWAND